MRLTSLHHRLNRVAAARPAMLSLPAIRPTRPIQHYLAELSADQQAHFTALHARIASRLGTDTFTLQQVTDDELDEIGAFDEWLQTSE
jgi:hypothetical protein